MQTLGFKPTFSGSSQSSAIKTATKRAQMHQEQYKAKLLDIEEQTKSYQSGTVVLKQKQEQALNALRFQIEEAELEKQLAAAQQKTKMEDKATQTEPLDIQA